MKAYISSKSPVKHAAVEASFARIGIAVETEALPTESGVSEQPMSFEETYQGAMNRHEKLAQAIGDPIDGYLVTVESGLMKLVSERGLFGVEVVVVEKDGQRKIGFDVDIEFPKEMTDRVPGEYADVGELVKAEHGAATKDPYPFFTNGKVTRQDLIEHTLDKVLMQFGEVSNNG